LAMWLHALSQIYNIKYHTTSFMLADKSMCYHFHVFDDKSNVDILTCGKSDEAFVDVSFSNDKVLCWDYFSDLILNNPTELINVDDNGRLRIPKLEKCVDMPQT